MRLNNLNWSDGTMVNINSFNKLQVQLCELKLEERRVKSDITKLVKNKQMVDFYKAQQLNSQKTSLNNKIQKLETLINPNIIA
jgi:hypothetical protein